VICGTPFGEAIHEARARGAVIAGTSAGASIQSSHMVAFGVGGATPKQRMTQVAAGLGLLESSVIDQHFDQRNRYGRLLMIVSQSPQLLGLGVDEDTAAIVSVEDEQEVLRVIGRGAVTIFDPTHMVSNAHEARRAAPILASGVLLHVLPESSAYNLTTRSLVPAARVVDDSEALEIAEVGRDLRRLARDIAAGDVSPTVLRRRRRNQEGATP
jgi:cyanophycinase